MAIEEHDSLPVLLLQSCHMAFDQVDASAVYLCTGNPRPEDIEAVLKWLLNDSIQDAFGSGCALHQQRAQLMLQGACPSAL